MKKELFPVNKMPSNVYSEIWIQTNGDKVRTITMEGIVSASVQKLLTTLNSFQNPMPFQNSISKYKI